MIDDIVKRLQVTTPNVELNAAAAAEIERLRSELKMFVNADIEWQDELAAAVAAERERCALVCEAHQRGGRERGCAAAIRNTS